MPKHYKYKKKKNKEDEEADDKLCAVPRKTKGPKKRSLGQRKERRKRSQANYDKKRGQGSRHSLV